MNNISPEEKLLRLIRGQEKQAVAVDKKSTTVAELKPSSNLSSALGIEPKRNWKIKDSLYPFIQKYLSFLNIRKIVLVAFVVSCTYLIVSFIYPWVGLRNIKLTQVSKEEIADLKVEQGLEIKPYEFYLEGIRNRQIFSSTTLKEDQRPASGVNVDLIKDINLVGIISGENPQAIIEDKKTQKTYYLNKGQFIGELQVEDIKEGKIILNYKEQRFELHL